MCNLHTPQACILEVAITKLFSLCLRRLKGLLDREKEELAEAEIIKDSPDSPEPPNKKPLVVTEDLPGPEKNKGIQSK